MERIYLKLFYSIVYHNYDKWWNIKRNKKYFKKLIELNNLLVTQETLKIKKETFIIKKNNSFTKYEKFHKIRLDSVPNNDADINGGGRHGRSEHGEAHFTIIFDNKNVEIYLPEHSDSKIPTEISKLDYKINELSSKKEKLIIILLLKKNNLYKIAKKWNEVNQDNIQPGYKPVKWAL